MSQLHYMTMARDELYELVWSKPLTGVAEDFGVERCDQEGMSSATGADTTARILGEG